jgi:hypothetical protein
MVVAATASGGETMAPKHEGRRPGHRGHHQLQRRADGQRGGHHQADRQQADRADVGLEVAPGGQQRGLVEDRRQHDDQDQLRVEGKLRQLRDQAEQGAADHQGDRVGKLEVARQPAQGHGADHQQRTSSSSSIFLVRGFGRGAIIHAFAGALYKRMFVR